MRTKCGLPWSNANSDRSHSWLHLLEQYLSCIETLPSPTSVTVYHSISVIYVGGVEVKVYCDDQATVCIDGMLCDTEGREEWDETVSDDIKLLAVKCFDSGGFGGFLASVGYDGNVLVSDGHWKCSDQLTADEEDEWYKLDFDDSHWNNAYVIELNGGGDGIRDYRSDFSDETTWLWTDEDFERASGLDRDVDRTIYCRSPLLGK